MRSSTVPTPGLNLTRHQLDTVHIHPDSISRTPLESVRRLHQGLHSFRNMRRMEASLRKARALRLRFSQSLASRRQRFSQAIVRSTIQRLGKGTNPLARSERLTISVLTFFRTFISERLSRLYPSM